MKGIIFFFSTTGNTMYVCKYIASRLTNGDSFLLDISKDRIPDLSEYDYAGFATYTDYWGPPKLVQDFFEKLPTQKSEIPAFILNTHAGESGKTLMILKDWAKAKGFKVIAGHSLITPLNFPPIIADGWTNPGDPDEAELESFNEFIEKFDQSIKDIANGINADEFQVVLDERDMSFSYAPRTKAREDIGQLFADEGLCVDCRQCIEVCPYHAIGFESSPTFDMTKCYGCWSCFNNCPKKAIYTTNMRGKGHYKTPDAFIKKLTI